MNRVKRINMLAGVTIATALFVSGCSSSEDEVTVEKDIIRPVKLITINSTDSINIRRFPAELKASEETDLAFRVGGQLMEMHVVAGQRVKKGELLAELDPTDFALQVELAEANQKLADAQFKRIQAIYEQNATTQAQYDSTKATLDQANNALQSAKNQLKYTKVYAPFSGVISSIVTDNFQYVGAAQTLMHIQNIDELDVEFQAPESLVVSFREVPEGYHPKVILDVAPEQDLTATYKEHNTSPNQMSMAYDVTMHLVRNSNSDKTLLPGMTANVDIDLNQLLGKTQHFVVPVDSVLRHENTNTGEAESVVWLFNPTTGLVNTRKVELGTLEGNQIEIISGLNVGDQIVAAGVSSLIEGLHVRPLTRERGL